jgi:hypothetical protein
LILTGIKLSTSQQDGGWPHWWRCNLRLKPVGVYKVASLILQYHCSCKIEVLRLGFEYSNQI